MVDFGFSVGAHSPTGAFCCGADDVGASADVVEDGAADGVVVAGAFCAGVVVADGVVARETSDSSGAHGTDVADVVVPDGAVVDVGVVVVVDVVGSHTSPDWASLFDVSVGCAIAAVTGVVTRNNAVADTASARVMFRLRMKCGADIKVILPLAYLISRRGTDCRARTVETELPGAAQNSNESCEYAVRGNSLLTVKGGLGVSRETHITI
jgi:hypothetical protein